MVDDQRPLDLRQVDHVPILPNTAWPCPFPFPFVPPDHAVHLAVHGVLHLAGYDHEVPKDAKIMEPLEVKILARLGISDPYASLKEAPQ